jgi:hypothetical protein
MVNAPLHEQVKWNFGWNKRKTVSSTAFYFMHSDFAVKRRLATMSISTLGKCSLVEWKGSQCFTLGVFLFHLQKMRDVKQQPLLIWIQTK